MLLFFGPFVLEEAALIAGAAVAATGELPAPVAFLALYAGTAVSDWLLYGMGYVARRSARLQSFIGQSNVERGRRLLAGSQITAALTARLVPWLLFPIFVACGYLRTGFLRFVVVNAIIALVYTALLFLGLYYFNLMLFELLAGWGWVIIAALALAAVLATRLVARRSEARRGRRQV